MTGWGAWLLVAISVAGCASRTGVVDPAPAAPGKFIGLLGKGAMDADEVRELQAQPAAEQRRRLDVVLASHPDDLVARYFRIQAELALDDDAAVVVDSDIVLADPSLERPVRRLILEWRAEGLLGLRRFDETIAVATQALEIDASSAWALFTRGWARFSTDQSDGALADLDRALQLDPNQAIGYFRRAIVLREQGKFDRAGKDFERAIELVPDDGASQREYGVLLYQTHDLERALAQFDAAARLMPSDPFVLTWRAQANLALKRFDAAAADDKRADELGAAGADLIHALNNVAIALEEQQDFAGAAREFAHSLALKATPAVAADLARTQWFSGQFGQAVETFREHAASPMSGDYSQLWLLVVRVRANPIDEAAAKAELAVMVPPHQPHVWTDTLVDMVLGKSTLEAALAEADAAATNKLRAGRRCEADYYAAEQFLMHGQDASASRLLEEAYRVCPSTYMEARAVVAERRLVEAKSLAHSR